MLAYLFNFPCRKNRTWEKDRRERLNHTFERLAKLLPDYEPKVTFSKIEILQKTIDYIEKLRLNYHGVSISSDADNSSNSNIKYRNNIQCYTHTEKIYLLFTHKIHCLLDMEFISSDSMCSS